MRESEIAERIASVPHVRAEAFSGYIRITTRVLSVDQVLDVFKHDVRIAEERIVRAAIEISTALTERGIWSNRLNVGISPKTGEIGLVIETRHLSPSVLLPILNSLGY